jgi:membrane protease YdiL (CAAX protease family)
VQPGSRLAAYATIVIVQWGLVIYVASGPRRLESPLAAAPSAIWRAWDVGLGLATAGAIEVLAPLFRRLASVTSRADAAAILPSTPGAEAAWVVVALSVGIGEETVYRGYLQRQLGARFRSEGVGVLAQAALFGLAHANQGALAIGVAVDGLILGLVARWRRNLLAAIMAHVAVDLLSGWASLR